MIIEEILKQRIQGVKNEAGHWVAPAFPKLLYFLEESNIHPDSEYFYITEIAAECSAKRLVPDYISTKVMQEQDGCVRAPMGCRAFLSSWSDENGEPVFYGRGNFGVTSINLTDAALSAEGDLDLFWKILDERALLCKESLMLRIAKFENVTTEVAPILWEHGALMRLPKGEKILPHLKGGYMTISLGYVGLYETVLALIGKSHTTPEGEKLALEIMKRLRGYTDQWKEETGYGFALYGTPGESLVYKFATACKNRFGEIPGITDRLYLTNSYHVNVKEEIDAFDKLAFESQFQVLSGGGKISYVEMPDMKNNLPAVMQLIRYIYDHIQYAELNTSADLCSECGYDGAMQVKDDCATWYCPNCSCEDGSKLHITRRTCGYLGVTRWNKGRTQDIKDRVQHLD